MNTLNRLVNTEIDRGIYRILVDNGPILHRGREGCAVLSSSLLSEFFQSYNSLYSSLRVLGYFSPGYASGVRTRTFKMIMGQIGASNSKLTGLVAALVEVKWRFRYQHLLEVRECMLGVEGT